MALARAGQRNPPALSPVRAGFHGFCVPGTAFSCFFFCARVLTVKALASVDDGDTAGFFCWVEEWTSLFFLVVELCVHERSWASVLCCRRGLDGSRGSRGGQSTRINPRLPGDVSSVPGWRCLTRAVAQQSFSVCIYFF